MNYTKLILANLTFPCSLGLLFIVEKSLCLYGFTVIVDCKIYYEIKRLPLFKKRKKNHWQFVGIKVISKKSV